MEWIYLSKNGNDACMDLLARGGNTVSIPLEQFDYQQDSTTGIVLRGIMKHKIIKQCWQDSRRFRYVDTGYFGNQAHARLNPGGWKVWHRIVENDLQQKELVQCPGDRWDRLDLVCRPWRSGGQDIVIVAPDEKPCTFYNIELEEWIETVTQHLQQFTDRPIVVRQRPRDIVKRNRSQEGSFEQAITNAHAVVTFNSNAAVESIMLGVPVFITHDVSAAGPVANHDLDLIETPWLADRDLVMSWLHGLAYSQFHNRELESGTAMKILDSKLQWPIIKVYK